MKEKVLNETTNFCNECASKECCPENECVLYRIEQIVNEKKTYKVEITETLQRVIEVEAKSEEEALETIEEQYRDEEIVLDYGDFMGYDVDIFKGD